MDLTRFKGVIKERCGLYFEDPRATKLFDSINARMSATGLDSPEQYYNCLLSDTEEFQRLVTLLTVNETYFFREPFHIDLLVSRLIPELRARGLDTINIISAGCSTGEEPYSIVMAAMDKYGIGGINDLHVTGLDIDREAIGRAKEGIFHENAFRAIGPRRVETYFEKAGPRSYRIRDSVKKHAAFYPYNLLSDLRPAGVEMADIIFYRNVSIYFDAEVRRKILCKLADLLNKEGYLIVSSSETFSHNMGVLTLTELDGIFLYRKDVLLSIDDRRRSPGSVEETEAPKSCQPETGTLPAAGTAAGQPGGGKRPVRSHVPDPAEQAPVRTGKVYPVKRSGDERHLLFDEALALARRKEYSGALSALERILRQDSNFSKALMLKAGILINMNRLEEAGMVCMQCLARDQWNLESYLFLGLIAKMNNDQEIAVKRFREALYIQSACWLAHFYLAEIFVARQELATACREYELVIRVLEKGRDADLGLTFFPLSFPLEQIVHLCRHNLSELRMRLA